jgi:hypothetical protein
VNSKELFKEIEIQDESGLFNFGKYKGLPINTIIERDPEYILWAEKNVITFAIDSKTWDKTIKSLIDIAFKNRFEKCKDITNINQAVRETPEYKKSKMRKRYFARKETNE